MLQKLESDSNLARALSPQKSVTQASTNSSSSNKVPSDQDKRSKPISQKPGEGHRTVVRRAISSSQPKAGAKATVNKTDQATLNSASSSSHISTATKLASVITIPHQTSTKSTVTNYNDVSRRYRVLPPPPPLFRYPYRNYSQPPPSYHEAVWQPPPASAYSNYNWHAHKYAQHQPQFHPGGRRVYKYWETRLFNPLSLFWLNDYQFFFEFGCFWTNVVVVVFPAAGRAAVDYNRPKLYSHGARVW